jgi:hypothetical protein
MREEGMQAEDGQAMAGTERPMADPMDGCAGDAAAAALGQWARHGGRAERQYEGQG